MTAPLDALVVGARPTGLALAARLRAHAPAPDRAAAPLAGPGPEPGAGGPGRPAHVHRLGDRAPWPGVAHGLPRPDGHLGYVAGGAELRGLRAYAAHWLPSRTT